MSPIIFTYFRLVFGFIHTNATIIIHILIILSLNTSKYQHLYFNHSFYKIKFLATLILYIFTLRLNIHIFQNEFISRGLGFLWFVEWATQSILMPHLKLAQGMKHWKRSSKPFLTRKKNLSRGGILNSLRSRRLDF